jgi:hypothetical protein
MPISYTSLRGKAKPPSKTEQIGWASPQQEEAFMYGPAPLCFSGGFGSGKTALGALKLIWYADTFPKSRIAVARKTWEDFKKTTLSTFLKFLHPSMYSRGRRSDVDKSLILNNGSEFMWMHLDNPDTENIIKGLEINAFMIDQAEETEEEIFERMMSRVGRWDQAEVPQWMIDQELAAGRKWEWVTPEGVPQPPPYSYLTCNPDHELHWIYRRFHEMSPEHWEYKIPVLEIMPDGTAVETDRKTSYHDLGYKMITSSSLDNKFLGAQNKQELMNRDASFIRRYVKGEWGMPEGKIHHINPESILEWSEELERYVHDKCYLVRVLDHGDSAPTCCAWIAIDQNGNSIVYREYYMPNKLISDHRRAIFDYSKGESYIRNLADPAIFNPSMQKNKQRWSVAQEYLDATEITDMTRETVIWWEAGDNDELGTRNKISEYLRVDLGRVNPFTGQKGSPRIFFVKKTDAYPQGCFHIIRETNAQRREKVGTELGRPIFSDDRDKTIADHGYDVVRYHVASRPDTGPKTKKSSNAKSFKAVQRQMKARNKIRRAVRGRVVLGRM